MPLDSALDLRSFQGLPAEPLRQFLYTIDLPNGDRIPDTMIKSVSEVPLWQLSETTQFQGRDQARYPDKRTLDPFTVTFHETVDLRVRRYFIDWHGRIVTPEGYRGLPIDYERLLSIELLNLRNQAVQRIRYEGVWPTKLTGFNMDVTPDEFVKPSVTFVAKSYEIL
jgi:hypothetical protein